MRPQKNIARNDQLPLHALNFIVRLNPNWYGSSRCVLSVMVEPTHACQYYIPSSRKLLDLNWLLPANINTLLHASMLSDMKLDLYADIAEIWLSPRRTEITPRRSQTAKFNWDLPADSDTL